MVNMIMKWVLLLMAVFSIVAGKSLWMTLSCMAVAGIFAVATSLEVLAIYDKQAIANEQEMLKNDRKLIEKISES
jgi:hypothetical protein